MPIKKRKLYCDEDRKTCSDPEIKKGKDLCNNGHPAKEMEKHRSEIDEFRRVADQQDKQGKDFQPPEKMPRTLDQIYDDLIKEHSKP